jgi:hypothetical protein
MTATARKCSLERKSDRKRSSTTVRILQSLYEEAKSFVGKNQTVGELIADSLREKLRRLRKERIDEAFSGMATDEKYQAETLKIAREFQASDWHALKQTEGK